MRALKTPPGGCSLVPPRVLVAEPQLEPEPSSHAAFLGVPVPAVLVGLKGEAQGRLGAIGADGMAGADEGCGSGRATSSEEDRVGFRGRVDAAASGLREASSGGP